MKTVWLVHVPYQVRGGEDQHVDDLETLYTEAGLRVVRFPGGRAPGALNFGSIARSLGSSFPKEWDTRFEQDSPSFVHLHNIFPVLGPRFLEWLGTKSVPRIQTVHNRRFFCANGLAFRNQQPCTLCLEARVKWRPVLYNCNDDLKRSAYYSAALSRIAYSKSLHECVDRWVAPSPLLAQELVKWGATSKNVEVIPHPVRKISADANARVPQADVVFAGRLSREKGVEDLIATVPLLPTSRFLIVGDGPLASQVKVAEDKNPNLKWLSNCPRASLGKILDEARLAVVPSRVNESFGLFAVEAMLAGKRCVVSQQEGLKWLTELPFQGIVANTRDPKSFAEAIEAALKLDAPESQHVRAIERELAPQKYVERIQSLI